MSTAQPNPRYPHGTGCAAVLARYSEAIGANPGNMEPVTSNAKTPAWVARVAWVLVAVIGGTAVEAAVDGRKFDAHFACYFFCDVFIPLIHIFKISFF